jgi:hypothetical protein
MAAAVERFDAMADKLNQLLHISAAPPLAVSFNDNGVRLSIANVPGVVAVTFGAPRTGGGYYAGTLGRWKGATVDTSTDFDATTDRISLGVDITIKNLAESNIATHRVSASTAYFAWPTQQADDAGRPVFETLYQHAVRFTRWNATTHTWQETYHDAATAADVADEFWVDVQEFIACPTP